MLEILTIYNQYILESPSVCLDPTEEPSWVSSRCCKDGFAEFIPKEVILSPSGLTAGNFSQQS